MRPRQCQVLFGCALLLVVVASHSRAQTGPPYVINTLAGGGPNNLPALSSSIGIPVGVAKDSAGNLYFSNGVSNVFTVNGSGNLTIFAGDGVPGFSGSAGLATQAQFDLTRGIFIDGSGNLFIADLNNNVIWEVFAGSGTIAVVAGDGVEGYSGDGGLATEAELDQPNGVAVDSAGDIFIADANNCLIREVSAATGNIQTVVGTIPNGEPVCGYAGDGGPATQAELNFPEGVALDSAGDIFIADTGNCVIREVAAANQTIQRVAGSLVIGTAVGACGFAGDGGLATSAELDLPYGVFVDSGGDILIADTYNAIIRCVVGSANGCLGSTLAVGDIATVAGTPGTFAYSGDGGLATSADLNFPEGVYVDSGGNIFIADLSNSRVREVGSANKKIETVAGNGTLGYSGDGHPATDAELNQPTGLAVDASQNVFVSDSYNWVVRELVAATGDIQTVAGNGIFGFAGDGGPATQAELHEPTGLALDSSGNIYVADSLNNRIRAVNNSASAITLAGVTIQPGSINTIAGNGTYGYSGDGAAATQAEIAIHITDNNLSNGTGTPQVLAAPEGVGEGGVAVGSNGVLYIADTENNRIRAVNTGTTSVTIAGVTIQAGDINTIAGNGTAGYSGNPGPATSAELDAPFNVAVDASGNIYVADTGNSVVRVINPGTSTITVAGVSIPGGDIATVAGDGSAGFTGDTLPATQAELNNPTGIYIDGSGDIFISDTFNSVVREVAGNGNDPNVGSSGTINTIAGSNVAGFLGDGGTAIDAELTFPLGIAVDSTGRIVFSDFDSLRIRSLTPTVCQTTHTQTGFTLNATISCTGNFAQGNPNQIMGFNWGDNTIAAGGQPDCVGNACSFSASHTYTSGNSFTVTPTVIDASGNTVITTGFMVSIPSTLTITPTTLPNGSAEAAYSQTLSATGGGGSYTWSISLGSLPPPLTINSTSGVISGTPAVTSTGVFNFTAQVEDTQFDVATLTLSITVGAQLVGPSCQPPTVTVQSASNPLIVAASTNCTAGSSAIASTSINWGDNSAPSSGTNATHTYANAGTYTITVTATDANNLTGVASESVTVTTPLTSPVAQGGSAQQTASVTAPAGVSSVAVTYSCTNVVGPNGAGSLSSYNLTCSVSPASVTLTSTPQSVTVTVQTTGNSAQQFEQRRSRFGAMYAALCLVPSILLIGIGGSVRRRKRLGFYATFLLFSFTMFSLLSCGGSISPPPQQPPSNSTPAGTYSVQAAGTSSDGSTQSTITIGFSVTIGS